MRAGCVPQPMRLADDTHIVEKPEEREKIDHYQDKKCKKIWKCRGKTTIAIWPTNATGTPDHARSQDTFLVLFSLVNKLTF